MKAAHTAGPWNLVGTEMIRAENGDTIAHICEYGRHSLTPDAQRHNARLIVAAPELLEALQTLLAYGLKMSARHEAPAFEIARIAINKATGA